MLRSWRKLVTLSSSLPERILALRERQAIIFFWIAAGALFLVQSSIIATTNYNLSADEAHYWEWSRRLDWSYYSKGPVVALLIRASTELLGNTEFAVRFPALLCSFLLSVAFFFYGRACFGPRRALLGWILLRTMLFFSLLGLVITTDPPALLFWMCALGSGYIAVSLGKPKQWLFAGLFTGLAILSKFTALVIYPSFALYLLLTPERRKEILSPHFLIGGLIAATSLVPVLVWNAQHAWVNFAHNQAHLISSKGIEFRPRFFFELIGGQLGLIGPIIFCCLLYVVWQGVKLWKAGDVGAGFLVCSIIPLALVCLTVALTKRVYANWPAPLYLPCIFLLLHLLRQERAPLQRMTKLLGHGIVLNLFLLLLVLVPVLGFRAGVPAKYLTMKKLVGWKQLAHSVEQYALSSAPKDSVVLAENYDIVSTLNFYSNSRLKAHVANFGDRRMNQYDIWGGTEDLAGRDALVVLKNLDKVDATKAFFERVELERQTIDIDFNGDYLRSFYLLKGYGFKPGVAANPKRF